jgi:uncharacterized membrane protein
MEYLTLKWLHILSAILLFGTGLGSAFYKFFTDRSGNTAAVALTSRLVVRADWLFTTPAVVIQPLTGLWLLDLLGAPWSALWVWLSLVLYVIAGVCWLPAVVLQMRMRNLAERQARARQPLPPGYQRMARTWTLLGIPAFSAMVLITALMVYKPT